MKTQQNLQMILGLVNVLPISIMENSKCRSISMSIVFKSVNFIPALNGYIQLISFTPKKKKMLTVKILTNTHCNDSNKCALSRFKQILVR